MGEGAPRLHRPREPLAAATRAAIRRSRASTAGAASSRVEKQRLRWEVLDAFVAACEQAGIPRREDFNDGDNEGVGFFEVNQKGGWRWNAARAFLRPAAGRANLVVRDRRRGRAAGARGRATAGSPAAAWCCAARRSRSSARRSVVLAAGAINSPKLLQLSGIGPGALLARHGIAVVADLPGVGANLQDHLQIRSV